MAKQGQVLIIDDEPDLGRLLLALLESEGYPAALATSANEALRSIESAKPSVIVLDLSLPDLDGVTLLRLVKSRKGACKIPVIVVSAYTGRLTASDRALTDAIFEKPFDLDAFANAVAAAHQAVTTKLSRSRHEVEASAPSVGRRVESPPPSAVPMPAGL